MPITTPIMQIKQKDQMNERSRADCLMQFWFSFWALMHSWTPKSHEENIIMQTLTTKMLIKNLHVCNLWFQGLVYLRIS